MRKSLALSVLTLATVSFAAPAQAAAVWTANAGTTVKGNVVTLNPAGPGAGTSLESADLGVEIAAGDTYTFEYMGGTCTAGSPRVFFIVDGVNDNSWDQNIASGTQCGSDADGDDWYTVTWTATQTGTIEQAGIVHDNGSDTTVKVRNLTVDGEKVPFGSANGKKK